MMGIFNPNWSDPFVSFRMAWLSKLDTLTCESLSNYLGAPADFCSFLSLKNVKLNWSLFDSNVEFSGSFSWIIDEFMCCLRQNSLPWEAICLLCRFWEELRMFACWLKNMLPRSVTFFAILGLARLFSTLKLVFGLCTWALWFCSSVRWEACLLSPEIEGLLSETFCTFGFDSQFIFLVWGELSEYRWLL